MKAHAGPAAPSCVGRPILLGVLYVRPKNAKCENRGTLTPTPKLTDLGMALGYNVKSTIGYLCSVWAVGWSE